jgi:hypothetical protein
MTRLFVATDNINNSLVENPNLPCQTHSKYVFYKNQAEELIGKRSEVTLWELHAVRTCTAII